MSEVAGEENKIVSIATAHQLAVCQPWAESEEGWVNPHSYSLHPTLEDAWIFIQGIYLPRRHARTTPSSYTRVEGAAYPVVVTERLFQEVEATRSPTALQSNDPLGSASGLVRRISSPSQYPGDCRNEGGEFPPAFVGDKVAQDWEEHFLQFGFYKQAATARLFNRLSASIAQPLD